ncbi:MAG: hypothetical protein ACLRVU_00960 [Beduini sp.]|uniref:hypothetical protein n=1 Tax=Beduini sp. TaxID=1922300 RepID=UPI0039A3498F
MKNRLRMTWKAMQMERREHKSSFWVYLILRAMVVVVMILQFFNRNYENVFFCLLTLFLLIIPSFIQVEFRIEIPTTLEIIILLFIFAAEILGEIHAFYVKIPLWDTLLHTMNGFLAAAIGFSLVDILNRNKRLEFHLSPLFMVLVAFCFSMTIGVVWEFFEFFMDSFFNMDMQKDTVIHAIHSVMLDPTMSNRVYTISSINEVWINGNALLVNGYIDIGLIDTMMDLIVNFVGAFIFSVFGFFYLKKRGKGTFVKRFIPRIKDKSKDYLLKLRKEAEK